MQTIKDEAILEGIEKAKKKANPFFCSLFKKKTNKILKTFPVDNGNEEEASYLCILAGAMGSLENDSFNNIRDYVTGKGKLSKESIEIKKQFEKYFRVLVTNK